MATTRKSRTVKPATAKDADPLAHPENRQWLEDELAAAEDEVKFGPNRQGWMNNESLRAGIEQHAAFLRAAIAKLWPPAAKAE